MLFDPMIFPNFEEFAALAAAHTLVPVAKTISADLQTPVTAFLSIARDEPEAFLLESIEGGEKIGRHTFLGVRPYMVFSARGQEMTIRRGKKVERSKGELVPKLKTLF